MCEICILFIGFGTNVFIKTGNWAQSNLKEIAHIKADELSEWIFAFLVKIFKCMN